VFDQVQQIYPMLYNPSQVKTRGGDGGARGELQSKVEKEQMVKSYEGPKFGHPLRMHTVSCRRAAEYQNVTP